MPVKPKKARTEQARAKKPRRPWATRDEVQQAVANGQFVGLTMKKRVSADDASAVLASIIKLVGNEEQVMADARFGALVRHVEAAKGPTSRRVGDKVKRKAQMPSKGRASEYVSTPLITLRRSPDEKVENVHMFFDVDRIIITRAD